MSDVAAGTPDNAQLLLISCFMYSSFDNVPARIKSMYVTVVQIRNDGFSNTNIVRGVDSSASVSVMLQCPSHRVTVSTASNYSPSPIPVGNEGMPHM